MFLPTDLPIRRDTRGPTEPVRLVAACSRQQSSIMDKARDTVRIVVAAECGRSGGVTSNGQGPLANALPPNTHFIAVSADSANEDAVHAGTTFVQYVESSGDTSIFAAAANGQLAYPAVYTVADGTVFNPNAATFYSASSATAASPTVAFTSVAGQTVAAAVVGNTTYILPHMDQSDPENPHPVVTTNSAAQVIVTSAAAAAVMSPTRTSPQTDSSAGYITTTVTTTMTSSSTQADVEEVLRGLGPANRVSPITVQWLMDNYETAEGVSLPRSTLYKHYIRHCTEHGLDPVNPASFGKLIRSVFVGLRTRRLGTRGNSKYHYYGIRLRPNSALNEVQIDEDDDEDECPSPAPEGKPMMKISAVHSSNHVMNCIKHATHDKQTGSEAVQTTEQAKVTCNQHLHGYLGEPAMPFPAFPEFDFSSEALALKGISLEDVEVFRALYEENCEGVMTAVIREHFNAVDAVWQQFWKPLREDMRVAACLSGEMSDEILASDVLIDEDSSGGAEADARQLSGAKLYLLCKSAAIQEFVRQADYTFYQYMVDYLVPDVLKPIPSHLTQAIRNFAKNLEGWLVAAMEGAPAEMINVKLAAVKAFAQTLRRYTSLNHLAQAARAVLQNTSQIQQMLNDLNRVDFYHVQEQASWVCECDKELVAQIETDFKDALQSQNSLEQWASWLEEVVIRALARFECDAVNLGRAARQFLLKWSFYSSMVIRDLTLRSAPSFGSFHLIRLLYDEYMFYLVEHKVATVSGVSPIAVMGDFLAGGRPQPIEVPALNGFETGGAVLEMKCEVEVDETDDNQKCDGMYQPEYLNVSCQEVRVNDPSMNLGKRKQLTNGNNNNSISLADHSDQLEAFQAAKRVKT